MVRRKIEWHDKYLAYVQDIIEGKENHLLCEKADGRLITENFTVRFPTVSAEWVLVYPPLGG